MTAVKILAWGVGAAYLIIGGALVVAMGVAGLWEGFAHRDFTLRFLGIAAYVLGTAALAFWVGARPSRLGGAALVVLAVPGVIMLVSGARDGRDLRETARAAVTAPDASTRDSARAALLALGQRSGRQPHLTELTRLLAGAEDDAVRLRIVTLLGPLSYLNRDVVEGLRVLRAETRDDPERATLYEAATAALRQVDPYSPIE